MRRSLRQQLVLLTSLVFFSSLVRADGLLIPSKEQWEKMRERAYVNEPEQKAVVFFSRGWEDLIISPSYEGPASNFAWVVPVPSRPKVEILKGAIFHELANLVAPSPPMIGKGRRGKALPSPQVEVLERKTVGAYDVSVLSAKDAKALWTWLAANRYHLPIRAVEPAKWYVRRDWVFVACRIKAPKSAKGLSTGTLAPLRLTFAASKPVYPIRLSSANPRPFALLLYLILPTGETRGFFRDVHIRLTSMPGKLPTAEAQRQATVKPRASSTPTLSRLCEKEVDIYVERRRLRPDECDDDYVWRSPFRRASLYSTLYASNLPIDRPPISASTMILSRSYSTDKTRPLS